MPEGLLDMTITSPPYDDLRDYNGYHFPVEEIAAALFHRTKKGGVVIWVVGDRTLNGNETLTSFRHAFTFQEAGFRVHDTMIYAKNNPIPSDCGKRYRQCFEYIFCFSKGQPTTFNPITQPIKQEKAFKSFRITKVGRNDLAHDHVAPKERKVNNIFFYNVGTSSSKDKIAFAHPAIFPEQLAMRPDLHMDERRRCRLRLLHGQRHDGESRTFAWPQVARLGDLCRIRQIGGGASR